MGNIDLYIKHSIHIKREELLETLQKLGFEVSLEYSEGRGFNVEAQKEEKEIMFLGIDVVDNKLYSSIKNQLYQNGEIEEKEDLDQMILNHKNEGNSFKEGDWVFHDFELKQIQEMENGKISRVSDGLFCRSATSLNDECFLLDMHIKNISDHFKYKWDQLENQFGDNFRINFSKVSNKFREIWVNACNEIIENYSDDEKVKEIKGKYSNEINDFCNSVHNKVQEVEEHLNEKVEGIEIFK